MSGRRRLTPSRTKPREAAWNETSTQAPSEAPATALETRQGLSQGAEGSPEATPPRSELEGVAAEPGSRPDLDIRAGAQADVIMSKLPRTRPQRVTGRRHRDQAPAGPRPRRRLTEDRGLAHARKRPTAQRTPRVQTGAAAQRSAPGPAEVARRHGARERPSRATTAPLAPHPPAAGRSPRRRPADRGPISPATPPAVTPARTGASAPGLPRLAVDGAVEAAKLPLKVGGRLTLRALDAVARGLRGG